MTSSGTDRETIAQVQPFPQEQTALQHADTNPWTLYVVRSLAHPPCLQPPPPILTGHTNLGAMTELRLALQGPIAPTPIEVRTQDWERILPRIFEAVPLFEYVLPLPLPPRPRQLMRTETVDIKALPLLANENVTGSEFRSHNPLQRRISFAFLSALDERFEDGMDSTFSHTLASLIQTYGNAGVAAVQQVLESGQTNAEIVAEALRWLGIIHHPESRKYRLWLLQETLRSASPRIRDAAGLGLAAMDDPDAIAALVEAIERERYAPLRQNLQLVLDQLAQTRRCLSS